MTAQVLLKLEKDLMKQKDILPYIGKTTNLTTAAQERFSQLIYAFWVSMDQYHYMQSF